MVSGADEQQRKLYRQRFEKYIANAQQLELLVDELDALSDDWARILRLQVIDKLRQCRPKLQSKSTIDKLQLPQSDGRPLYAYRLERSAFDDLENELCSQVGRHGQVHSGAFVLWASEWFRRCYSGGMPKWEALGDQIGLNLDQAGWRALADKGLKYWGHRAANVGGMRYRLKAIARQAGFPVAAISDGQGGWAHKYLSAITGNLLGMTVIREETAEQVANEHAAIVPDTWRNNEMQTVCAQLSLAIVELRRAAERAGATGLLLSNWLEQNRPDWRDSLPMAMERKAAGLIDTLLQVKAVPGGGAQIRARRLLEQQEDGSWLEKLELDLDGSFQPTNQQQYDIDKDGHIARLRIFASGEMARVFGGELATARTPDKPNGPWPVRKSPNLKALQFSFNRQAEIQMRSGGVPVGGAFILHGGEAVRSAMRIYEADENKSDAQKLWLKSWSSGSFKAEELFIEIPTDWIIRTQSKPEQPVENQPSEFAAGNNRIIWKVSCSTIVENPQGDQFLIRPGQDVRRRDGLLLNGKEVGMVINEGGLPIFAGNPFPVLTQNGQQKPLGDEQVGKRRIGDSAWQSRATILPSGKTEFAWRDATTGHLRAKSVAIILPDNFEISTTRLGDCLNIEVKGWKGSVQLVGAIDQGKHCWRYNTAKPTKDRLELILGEEDYEPVKLQIPLPEISWIAQWNGDLAQTNSAVSLAALTQFVARGNGRELMAHVTSGSGQQERRWPINDIIGLSSIRDDLARMIWPLGIDAQVQLNFNDGRENHWYVREFEAEIEYREHRGWFANSLCGEDQVEVRARAMAKPASEIPLGVYSLQNSISGQPLPIPRLTGTHLVYIAADNRVLSRPRLIGTSTLNNQAHCRLGRAMTQTKGSDIDAELFAFVDAILSDPTSDSAIEDIKSVIALAHSLRGLPPATFKIFELLNERPELGPYLAMHSGQKELQAVLSLADGLLFDWATVPVNSWLNAREALGNYYMRKLSPLPDENPIAHAQRIISMVTGQIDAIIDLSPWLASTLNDEHDCEGYATICRNMIDRAGDRIDRDTRNSFRPDLVVDLPSIQFAEGICRVCDAPYAAALAACDKVELKQKHIMAVKDVREYHPQFFGEAYACAIKELK